MESQTLNYNPTASEILWDMLQESRSMQDHLKSLLLLQHAFAVLGESYYTSLNEISKRNAISIELLEKINSHINTE